MKPPSRIHTGTFRFEANDPIYKDHFPGQPVVPGSLIVQAFATAAKSLPVPFEAATVSEFRFKRFVTPGTYAYRLELRDDGEKGDAWYCRLLDGDQTVVSGVLT